jgi:hypothetical protein
MTVITGGVTILYQNLDVGVEAEEAKISTECPKKGVHNDISGR